MRSKLILALLGTAIGQTAVAQEGGTKMVFGLNSGLRASDNWIMEEDPADTSYQFNNALSFSLSSETRSSRIAIDLGANLQHSDISGTGVTSGLSDPTARVSFSRTGPDSVISLNAGVSLADQEIDFSDSIGTRTDSNVGATYSFGTGQRFGGSISADLSETNYTGSPDNDDKTSSISGSLHFQTSAKLTIRPNASITRYVEDDGGDVETTTESIGVGLTAQIDDVSSVKVDVSHKKIDSDNDGVTEGATGRISYMRSVPNGSHTFAVSTDISNEGPRTGLSYSRSLQFAQTQASYGIGASRSADGSDNLTANFDITQPLQRGQVNASLDRGFATDVEGVETLTTSFSAGLSQDLSDTSGIDLSLAFSLTEETMGPTETDASATLSYRMKVAEDWNLTAGLEHRFSDDDTSDPIRGNTVFLTFARTWESIR